MYAIGACLYTFQIHERSYPGQTVAVQFERCIPDDPAQRRDQGPDAINGQQSSSVLYPNRVDLAALDKLLRGLHVELVGMHGRQTIRQSSNRAGTQPTGNIQGCQHVIDII